MSRDEAIMALKVGIDTANDVINQGARVIGLGEMGIANTTASSAVTAVLTGEKPTAVVGLGTGITPALLSHKVGIIETALAVNTPDPDDVIDVLAKVGGLEITALAGVALASAARRVPVMLDGFISSVAALAAYRLAPAIQPYLIASHLSAEPGHAVILETLKLKPRLLLDLRLGEGTGAALGMSLLDAGVKILNEMATFDEAQVAKAIDDKIYGEIL
jgi:nicotinate-nucleotide--dimethylbenzimidazole phosphoribosyltransferase